MEDLGGRWGAALPVMLPLGRRMGQKRKGGRKSDRLQDDDELAGGRRDIEAGVQQFLAKRAVGRIVRILGCRCDRPRHVRDMIECRQRVAMNMGLDGQALDREGHQHEQHGEPRQKRSRCRQESRGRPRHAWLNPKLRGGFRPILAEGATGPLD